VFKGSSRIVDPVLVSECNDFEYYDVTSMTSYSHVTSSMTSPIDATCALSYRFPIGHEPQNRLVSVNVKDRQKRPNRAVKTLNGQLNYRNYHH